MKTFFIAIASYMITWSAYGQISDQQFETLLIKCEGFNSGKYTCTPYIQAAVYLQTLEPMVAKKTMGYYAETGKYEDQMFVLIKMFFVSPTNVPLRRPMIGAAAFMGGTDYPDWNSEPIELVNKVPFLITQGYSLGGQAERSLGYFQYCLEFGQWTTNNYKLREDDLKSALNLLIDNKKWPTPLTDTEKSFLEGQIK